LKRGLLGLPEKRTMLPALAPVLCGGTGVMLSG